MKELRAQHQGRLLRTLFAFDPRRCAILLIGGDKTGDDRFYERMVPLADRFYERMVPLADRLYDQHLVELENGGLI